MTTTTATENALPGLGYVSLLDAAWWPSNPPKTDGVCVYAGGDTPNPQTPDVCKGLATHYEIILPVWVRSDPAQANAASDARAFYVWCWKAGVTRGSLVALDSETSIDPAYVREFYTIMRKTGFTVLDYGSTSTVYHNENPDGLYWAADWTGRPHMANGAAVTQYVSYQAEDLSIGEAGLPWWRPNAPKTPPPAPVPGHAPTMPQGVTATDVTADGFTLKWAPVAHATAYRVRITYMGMHVWSATVTAPTALVTGRRPDHTYRAHVSATVGNVGGPETNGPEVKTLRGA